MAIRIKVKNVRVEATTTERVVSAVMCTIHTTLAAVHIAALLDGE